MAETDIEKTFTTIEAIKAGVIDMKSELEQLREENERLEAEVRRREETITSARAQVATAILCAEYEGGGQLFRWSDVAKTLKGESK